MSRFRIVGPNDPPPNNDGSWQVVLDDLLNMHGQVGEMRAEVTLMEGFGEVRAALISLDDSITRAVALVQTRLREIT